MRLGRAAVIAAIVGLTVDAVANGLLYAPFDIRWPPNITGFWGVVYGSFAAVITFGLTLWRLGRGRKHARAGRVIAVVALGLFGLAAAWWIVMWRVPLASLEGAWMYPLAVVPLIAAIALVRS